MNSYAIKNPNGVILGFTVSAMELSAKVKIQDAKNENWHGLYMKGYRVIKVAIIELKS